MINAEDEEQLFNDPALIVRRRKVGEKFIVHIETMIGPPQCQHPITEGALIQVVLKSSRSCSNPRGHVLVFQVMAD